MCLPDQYCWVEHAALPIKPYKNIWDQMQKKCLSGAQDEENRANSPDPKLNLNKFSVRPQKFFLHS